ncbi:MAG: hypothetical protein MK110_11360 [Fuerstiella sp.]|nr:hypothetical protein [Fuerstiella sp.]
MPRLVPGACLPGTGTVVFTLPVVYLKQAKFWDAESDRLRQSFCGGKLIKEDLPLSQLVHDEFTSAVCDDNDLPN